MTDKAGYPLAGISGFVLQFFNFKYVDCIDVGTAKYSRVLWLIGNIAAVAQNVDIRECNVHCHGTELTALRVEIETVADFMAAVTAARPFAVNQRYAYFRTIAHCYHFLCLRTDFHAVPLIFCAVSF